MTKKMFVFDLDGVLVEACDWHRDALNDALEELYNYRISQVDHVSTFNGIPTSKKLLILSDRGIVPAEDHQKVNDLKQSKTISIIEDQADIRPEKVMLLQALRDQGYVVCCYTNSITKTAHLMLEKTGIKHLFDTILSNQDVENPKPHPEGYLHLMEKYDIKKNKCYIVEDSPKGRAAAYASGANVIEVDNSHDVTLQFIRERI